MRTLNPFISYTVTIHPHDYINEGLTMEEIISIINSYKEVSSVRESRAFGGININLKPSYSSKTVVANLITKIKFELDSLLLDRE